MSLLHFHWGKCCVLNFKAPFSLRIRAGSPLYSCYTNMHSRNSPSPPSPSVSRRVPGLVPRYDLWRSELSPYAFFSANRKHFWTWRTLSVCTKVLPTLERWHLTVNRVPLSLRGVDAASAPITGLKSTKIAECCRRVQSRRTFKGNKPLMSKNYSSKRELLSQMCCAINLWMDTGAGSAPKSTRHGRIHRDKVPGMSGY